MHAINQTLMPLTWWQSFRGPCVVLVIMVCVAIYFRPPIPIDETRYLAVAWEMWVRGDFLVPHLLDEPYHHKPPLLFWCMHAGWWLFGVNDWWPRCVAPIFAGITLALTIILARLWFPKTRIDHLTAWLMIGMLFWLIFATLTMFDMLISACALTAMLGMSVVALKNKLSGWIFVSIGICAGILSKGPVILVHILPVALLAPWWASLSKRDTIAWYSGLLSAIVFGGALSLAWVIPACERGGPAFADALLWHQSAGRITGSEEVNAHAHPWWWFLPFLPAIVAPWIVWPPMWRRFHLFPKIWKEPGIRMASIWIISAFVIHSIISGKQVHYLVPLIPPAAIIFARLLHDDISPRRRFDDTPIHGLFIIIAVVMIVGPLLSVEALQIISLGNREAAPQAWGQALGWQPGVAIACVLLLTMSVRPTSALHALYPLIITEIAVVIMLHISFHQVVRPAYDLKDISERVASWQAAGHTVIRVKPYRGEYQFLGRLTKPPLTVWPHDLAQYLPNHPGAFVMMTYKPSKGLPPGISEPVESFPHRGVRLGIWRAETMLIPPQTPTEQP